jgi:hypothetical protein
MDLAAAITYIATTYLDTIHFLYAYSLLCGCAYFNAFCTIKYGKKNNIPLF